MEELKEHRAQSEKVSCDPKELEANATQAKARPTVHAPVPNLRRAKLLEALVVKSVNLRNLPAFMVSSNER